MALGYVEGSIAGVSLVGPNNTPFRARIIDGANLRTTIVANTERTANGKPKTQVFEVGKKGAAFGIVFDHITKDKFDAVIAAVEASMIAGDPFVVNLTDGSHDDFFPRNCNVATTGESGTWFAYPDQRNSSNTLKSVTMRFVVSS